MLNPSELKELGRLNNIKPLIDIFSSWGIILASLYLTHLSLYWIPFVIPIIAARLHSLTVLMHDGAHFLLNKNKIFNDIISNLLCSFPLMLSTETYRKSHWKHHQHTQTFDDPNYVIMKNRESWHYPKPKTEVKRLFIKDLLLMTMKDHLVILKGWQIIPHFKSTTTLEKILFPIYLLGLISILSMLHLWKDFLILQFAALFINPISRMRAMSEHIHMHSMGQSRIHKLQETPTINANLLEKFFIAPFNTNRHLEHHLYPTIPYFNLEKAHQKIKDSTLYKTYCLYELDGYFMGKRTSYDEVLSQKVQLHQTKKAA